MTDMKLKFPFFDLTRQYQAIKPEVVRRFSEMLNDPGFMQGEETTVFEKEMAAYLGVKFAISVSSGTDALVASLLALNIGPGDEVITTPFSTFATAGAILFVGAKPVFVDIDAETYNLDATKLQKSISRSTKAIMPVHMYGQCADMSPILEVGRRHGIAIIEDFAQALGAQDRGRFAGAMGDLGITHFGPNKNLGGQGDAALIVTNDADTLRRIRMSRMQYTERRTLRELLGTHGRMDGMQAALLNVKARHLKNWLERRNEIAQTYIQKLNALSDMGVVVPSTREGQTHSWNQFVIRVPQRDLIRKQLAEAGIPTEVYYPQTLPQQKALRGICAERGWPEAERAARSVLALPIFPELEALEQEAVVEGLTKVLRTAVRKDGPLADINPGQ
ncbi:MAG: DegT/DnrJ/EryC1/StrS family aminotransferase [Bdellovibrionia bacterium]